MNENLRKRFLLFLIGCIGTRCALAYTAKRASPTVLQIMGYIAIIPALGFFYLYFSGTRKTGPEVFGDKIWWNNLRPVHGFLYSLFAYHAIMCHSYAWAYLLIDVIVGLSSFLFFHLANVSFE